MTFVTYGQNFEDLILWRALKHVQNGFYIDVGAHDPVSDSVSMGFYMRGWRGVHVEASATYAEKLRRARPDEIIIELAIDREEGEIVFYEIPSSGLSTGDQSIAARHAKTGLTVKEKAIKSIPLSKVLDGHLDRDVHWLKIDVEGMEDAAIDGWLPSKVRPWVVAVESTLPNGRELSHHVWEPKLEALGYDFVYFDGLNRFYVSHAHPELKPAFGLPPNIFDDFVITPTSSFSGDAVIALEEELRNLRQTVVETTAARIALEEELRNLRRSGVELRAAQISAQEQLQAMRRSRSWIITAPLRKIALSLQLAVNGIVAWVTLRPGSRPWRVLKAVIVVVLKYVRANPKLMSVARRIARLSPRITNRLRFIYSSSPSDVGTATIWKYDPDPQALQKWLIKLNSSQT